MSDTELDPEELAALAEVRERLASVTAADLLAYVPSAECQVVLLGNEALFMLHRRYRAAGLHSCACGGAA